jgi:rhodanese-related sulfurtransferase
MDARHPFAAPLLLPVLLAAGCAPHISRSELAERIADGSAPPIVDVRSDGEYADAHVPGAVHIPFYSVWSRSDELPTKEGEPLVVYCEHGPRAGLARAGLWIAGAGEVRFLEGHMTAWKADGLPVESSAPEASRD